MWKSDIYMQRNEISDFTSKFIEEAILFPLYILGTLIKKSSWRYTGSFLEFLSCSIAQCKYVDSYIMLFSYYSFLGQFKIRWWILKLPGFFFSWFPGPFMHYFCSFRWILEFFFISVKNDIEILIVITLKIWTTSGSMNILTLNSSNPRTWILVSVLYFYINIL